MFLMKNWNRIDLDIDHKYRNRSDNQLENIRAATPSNNMCNARIRSDNKSGYPGVSWDKLREKWRAQINIKGKSYYIGLFNTAYEAHLAYEKAAKELHGEFAKSASN